MKNYALSFLLFCFASSFAQATSYLDYASDEFCPGRKMDSKKDAMTCDASDSEAVLSGKKGKTLTVAEKKALKFHAYSAVDAGFVPDADSNTAYFYTRWLVDAAGNRVGVLTIEGWYNTEMEDSARFDTRYNLKGQAVSVEVKGI